MPRASGALTFCDFVWLAGPCFSFSNSYFVNLRAILDGKTLVQAILALVFDCSASYNNDHEWGSAQPRYIH